MRVRGKRVSEISWRDVKNYFRSARYRETREVIEYMSLPARIFSEMEPVFVLSTGRCGTELLVNLFKPMRTVVAYHEPRPRLFLGSKMAYEMGPNRLDAKKLAFVSARYDELRHVYLSQKRYIETSNRMTFFADAIYDLFPRSQFIHVVRHPGSFVRSGIRRKYYTGNENDDGRLVPLESDPVYRKWEGFSSIEKIGWLWNVTNQFIEDLKHNFDSNRIMTIKAEDLFKDPETFVSVCSFLHLEALAEQRIRALIDSPANRQLRGSFPQFGDWTRDERTLLKNVTALAGHFGYEV